jgi:hypothetical protein
VRYGRPVRAGLPDYAALSTNLSLIYVLPNDPLSVNRIAPGLTQTLGNLGWLGEIVLRYC